MDNLYHRLCRNAGRPLLQKDARFRVDVKVLRATRWQRGEKETLIAGRRKCLNIWSWADLRPSVAAESPVTQERGPAGQGVHSSLHRGGVAERHRATVATSIHNRNHLLTALKPQSYRASAAPLHRAFPCQGCALSGAAPITIYVSTSPILRADDTFPLRRASLSSLCCALAKVGRAAPAEDL